MSAVLQAPVVQRSGSPDNGVFLHVKAPAIASACRPGQFVMVGSGPEYSTPHPLLKRALAIYDTPPAEPDTIVLLLKVVGDGTRRLATLAPGEEVTLVGPLGNGFDLETTRGRRHLIVAGGTGIASVFLAGRELASRGEPVTLLYGGRRRVDLVGLDQWRGLGARILTTTEDGSAGEPGLVTSLLEPELSSGGDASVLTCGPHPMMEAVAALAADAGVACQLSVESKMACGFGVCLGCTVRVKDSFRLSCTHGPVFNAADFVWESAPPSEPVAR